MASSGVESVRTNFFWTEGQPSRGVTDFARTDAARTRGRGPRPLAAARGHGSTTLGSPVSKQERLARRSAWPTTRPTSTRSSSATGPRAPSGRRHPTFPKRPIREWQIWNEPKLPYQWHRRADKGFKYVAPAYGALLRASRHTLKGAGPRGEGGAGGD